MPVALSSLRVTADMDASAYTAGMQRVTTANQAGVVAANALGTAWAQQDAAAGRASAGFARVSREFVNGYGDAAKFEAAVRRVGNALDRAGGDTASLERAGVTLDLIYRKYGLIADGATLAKQGFSALVPVVDQLNQHYSTQATIVSRVASAQQQLANAAQAQATINARLGVREAAPGAAQASADAFLGDVGGLEGVARARASQIAKAFTAELDAMLIAGTEKSARDSASVFERELSQIDEIASLRAKQIGQNFQQGLNDSFGIGATPRSARDSAGVFAEADKQAAAEAQSLKDRAAAVDDLVRKYAPLRQADEARATALAEIDNLRRTEKITEEEHAVAVQRVGAQYLTTTQIIKQQSQVAATGGRLMAGEIVNLSYQLNDVLTGIALGQSPFMILAQQGGQVYQILANSRAGLTGALKEMGSLLVGLATPAVLAFGTLAAGATFAVAALNSYINAQAEVKRNLSGIGRASGLTAGGVETIANQNSSPLGFSVAEARSFAATLASVGEIGGQEISKLTSLGHDFAKTLGVDAAEAAKLLSAALAEPSKGVDSLNSKLGFADDAMVRRIKNLVEQNNLIEAQRLLVSGVSDNVAKAADVTGFWSKVWTGISNASSDAFTATGRGMSNLTGLGQSTEDRLAQIQGHFDLLAKFGIAANPLSALSREADALNEKLKKAGIEGENVKLRLESVRIGGTVRSFLPEVDALQKLNNQQATVNGVDDPMLKRLGLSPAQVDRAKSIINDVAANFRTAFEAIETAAKISFDAVTAFSPAEKASIALRQEAEQLRTRTDLSPAEKTVAAQNAYNLSLHQTYVAIQEQTRAAIVGAQQQVAATQLSIDLIGSGVEERERSLGALRIEQQIEQQISQQHLQNDPAALALLKQRGEELKRQNTDRAIAAQLEFNLAASEKLRFEASQTRLPNATQGAAGAVYAAYGNRPGNDTAKQEISDLNLLSEALKQTTSQEALVRQGYSAIFAALDRAGQNRDLAKILGLSPEDVEEIKKRLEVIAAAFLSTFEKTIRSNAIAAQAITAYSPGAKGQIAQQTAQLQLMDQVRAGTYRQAEADKLAADAGKLATAQALEGLKEAQRERVLAAQQTTKTAQVELDMIGKTIGEQYRLQAVEQARQTLEQEAARNRTAFDQKKLDDLTKEIELTAKLKQSQAERGLQDRVKFDRQTAFFTPDDLKIAQEMKNIYGDEWQSHMNDAIAGQMRFNALLKDINDSVVQSGLNGLQTALTDIAMGTKTAGDAFRNLGLTVIRSIEEMIIKMLIIKPIAAGLQSLLGGMFPGVSPSAGGGALDVNNGFVPFVDGGGIVASRRNGGMVDSSGPYAYVHPAYYENAPRMRNGGFITDDGVPIVAHPGERILNRAEAAEYNRGSSSGSVIQNSFAIHYSGSPPADPGEQAAHAAEMRRQFEIMMNNWAINEQRVGGLLRPN